MQKVEFSFDFFFFFVENVNKVQLSDSWAISTRRANAHLGSSH